MSEVKKAVLAYSGGLDTSVILKWLQDTYQCEVVTFTGLPATPATVPRDAATRAPVAADTGQT